MRSNRGFTLMEMIIAMVITGILGAVVAVFISGPVAGYVDTARRAELTDMADLALKRMALEIRTAAPNTVRVVAAQYVQFIPVAGGGRYCTDTDTCPTPLPLTHFNPSGGASATVDFDVLGPISGTLAVNDKVIIFNTGQSGLDAYAGDNCATLKNTAAPLQIEGPPFPYASPSNRFLVAPASGPVRFACSANQVTRTTGHAFCGVTPAAASSLLVAATAVACNFSYDAVSAANGLLTMTITLTREGESVTLHNQIHVDNLP